MTQPKNVAGKELVGPLDLRDEHWREYDWNGRVYRIDSHLRRIVAGRTTALICVSALALWCVVGDTRTAIRFSICH